MNLPKKRSERIAALFLIGLFLLILVFVGAEFYLIDRIVRIIPLKDALWVTDSNIEKIYGPGSPEQQQILFQLTGPEWTKLKLTAPVLYKIPEGATHATDGFLIYGFDPNHPEMALALKHGPSLPPKTKTIERPKNE